MTDEEVNKAITEFMGECWHEFDLSNNNVIRPCIKCGQNWWGISTNSFSWFDYLAPENFLKVWEKAKEDERWEEFRHEFCRVAYREGDGLKDLFNRIANDLIGPQFVRKWAEFIGEGKG